MIIAFNIFIILLLGGLLIGSKSSSANSRKVYIILITLQLTLLSGLRHWSVGADTTVYAESFFNDMQYSFLDAVNNFINIFFGDEKGKDPGYFIFVKIVQFFTDDYQIYLLTIAIIFTFSLGYFIFRNSTEPVFSFLLYSCLFWAFFSITGHRQTLATALCLIGYEFIKKKKLLPFAVLNVFAFVLHKSSMVFFLFYFLAHKKVTRTYFAGILLLFPIIMINRIYYSNLMKFFSGYDEYGINEAAGTGTFTTIFIIIAFVTFWRLKIIIQNNPQASHYINAILIGLLLLPLTWVNPSAMRIVQYFSIFLILLIPEIIKSFRNESHELEILAYYMTTGILILLFWGYGETYYKFFWQ